MGVIRGGKETLFLALIERKDEKLGRITELCDMYNTIWDNVLN